MGFQAAHAVAPLDWTFRPFMDAAGTIAEPTQQELETFLDALKGVASEQDVTDESAPLSEQLDDVRAALAEEGLVRTFWPKVIEALVTLCKGSPSAEQIEALPVRHRFAFLDWLQSELTDPTKPSAGMRRSPVPSANGAPITS